MRFFIASFVFLFSALSAQAAPVGAIHACELESGLSLNKIDLLMSQPKSYAEGAIKVAYVATEDPVSADSHVLVFVRNQETGMFMECFAASIGQDGSGFSSVNIDATKAKYDAKTGLHLTVPVTIYDGEKHNPAVLKIRVDRSGGTNKVSVE